jgi:hypothetical protein
MAALSDRFRAALAAEQERLTNSITDLIRDSQNKGWINGSLDARSIAVFIQAYSLGRAVDDIAITQVDPASWTNLIQAVTAPLA